MKYFTFICTLIVCCHISLTDAVCKNGYEEKEKMCYKTILKAETYDVSKAFCESEQAELVSDSSDLIHNYFQKQLRSLESDTYYMGLTIKSGVYKWADSQKLLKFQGCSKINSETRLTKVGPSNADMNPDKCIQYCKGENYKFAGVNFENSNVACSCGNSFVLQSSYSVKCNKLCSDNLQKCGDSEYIRVYSVNYIGPNFWAYKQPNNYENRQNCLSSSPSNKYKYGDEFCNDDNTDNQYGYICEYVSVRKADCNGNGMYYAGGKCISIHDLSSDKQSWYEGRYQCLQRSARLLEIDDDSIRNYLEVELHSENTKNPVRYWIGGSRISTTWSNGNEVTYTKWARGKPNRPDQDPKENFVCVVMKKVNGGQSLNWEDVGCTEKHSFICQYALQPPTTTTPTTTTTTTTTPATTTTTPATTTTTTPAASTTTTATLKPQDSTTTKQSTPGFQSTTPGLPDTPSTPGNGDTTTSNDSTTSAKTSTPSNNPSKGNQTKNQNKPKWKTTGVYIAIAVAAVLVVIAVLRLFVAFCRREDGSMKQLSSECADLPQSMYHCNSASATMTTTATTTIHPGAGQPHSHDSLERSYIMFDGGNTSRHSPDTPTPAATNHHQGDAEDGHSASGAHGGGGGGDIASNADY